MTVTAVDIRLFDPSDADWIATRHGALYRQDEGFDASFGPLVADILAEFVKSHDPKRERGWVAWQADRRVGCIFCVGLTTQTAKLRLFLTEPDVRGFGLGQRLLDTCLGFACAVGYSDMTLWTHESHTAACALYAKNGFDCVASKPVRSFGQDLVEQTWVKSWAEDGLKAGFGAGVET